MPKLFDPPSKYIQLGRTVRALFTFSTAISYFRPENFDKAPDFSSLLILVKNHLAEANIAIQDVPISKPTTQECVKAVNIADKYARHTARSTPNSLGKRRIALLFAAQLLLYDAYNTCPEYTGATYWKRLIETSDKLCDVLLSLFKGIDVEGTRLYLEFHGEKFKDYDKVQVQADERIYGG